MMDEGIKLAGALAWVIGLAVVFVSPPFGALVLIVAVLLSIMSVTRTKERRHQEILDATRNKNE